MQAQRKPIAFCRLLFCCCIACWMTDAARARDTLTWAIHNWPPIYILPGEGVPLNLVGQGSGDLMVDSLSRALPEYEHRHLVINAERARVMYDSGAHLCSATAILTPERDKTRYFTYTLLAEPRYLITSLETKSKLPLHNGAVSLVALMHDARFKGLIVSERSYGPDLDAILRGPERTDNLASINSPDMGGNLMRMQLAGRMDYTIEYPTNLAYLSAIDKRFQALVAIPIVEAQKMTMAGVACPRTPWGKTVIEKVDRAVAKLTQTRAHREMLETWLSPEQRQTLRKQIDDFYAFRSVPGRTNF